MTPGVHGPSGTPLDPLLAAILGAIQGATEFLPVSSSGHLTLAQAWLQVDPTTAGHRFNIIVHAGTLLAVVWAYRTDLWRLLRAVGDRTRTEDRRLILAVILGTLPLGLVLIPPVKALVLQMEGNVRAVGVALLATAGLLVSTHRPSREGQDPTLRQALIIGLAQLMAVTPGISRSGSTIAVALFLGVGRREAARYSFLLSIPAILGATLLEARDLLAEPAGSVNVTPLLVGFVVSLLVGLASLLWLLRIVQTGRLWLFVPYLVLIGGIAVVVGG